GIEQLKTSAERGVAGIVAVTLAMPAAQSTVYAIAIGIVLYILIERPNARQRKEMQANSLSDSKIDSVDKDY
ncbi:hypothetical protein ACS8FD_19650, partial [Psychrobacter sp. 1U2]